MPIIFFMTSPLKAHITSMNRLNLSFFIYFSSRFLDVAFWTWLSGRGAHCVHNHDISVRDPFRTHALMTFQYVTLYERTLS